MTSHHEPTRRELTIAPRKAQRVLLTERDRRLLRLIGEQYALSVEQLARLTSGAGSLRDRWSRAGWVGGGRLTYTLPWLMWLTADGAAIANSPYRTWEPKPAHAEHLDGITNVRLLLEHELGLGEWRCERELAQAAGPRSGGQFHVPDGLLDTGRDQVAIEVELSLKSRARLAAIVEELAIGHDRVWYFAREPVVRSLREVLRTSPWENVSVYPYPVGAGDLLA
jgi:hypothetical protein